MDPYLDPDPGGGNMAHKNRKKYEVSCFERLDVLF
jgi:hypothetical protein